MDKNEEYRGRFVGKDGFVLGAMSRIGLLYLTDSFLQLCGKEFKKQFNIPDNYQLVTIKRLIDGYPYLFEFKKF